MAVLRDAINALDPSHDKKSQLTLLLTLLSELCEQKVNDFTKTIEQELRTAGTVENKTIPVTEILGKHSEYRAYIKSDVSKIAAEVTASIGKFVAGTSESILDGVADLVTTGLKAIIGAGSGSQAEMASYYVLVQGYSILRFDIRAWSRQIEAEGITTQIESALALVAYKSSVDVNKISLNTFLATYQNQLASIGIPQSSWEEYLNTAENVFTRLRSDGSNLRSMESSDAMGAPIVLRVPGELYGSEWK